MAIGLPIAFVLGSVALFYFLFISPNVPIGMVPQKLYAGADNFVQLAVYFFIFAGELMNRARITDALINFCKILVGWIPGGLAQVNILASVFFAGITGSGVADTAAIGSVLIPAMEKDGYTPEYSTAVTVTSSVIGPIIPPSVIMVVFSTATGVSVGALFAAGFIPGVAIALSLSALALFYAIRDKHPRRTEKITVSEITTTIRKSFVALLCPIILIGGIFSGWFTPTEAAAVACFYAIVAGIFLLRTISWKDVVECFTKAVISGSVILLIISMASLFGQYMTLERVPAKFAQFILGLTRNKYLFLLLSNLLFLFMGMIMETSASVLLLAPILVPIAINLGIAPIHYALIMIVNLNIGLSTPPLGVCLFVAAPISGLTLEQMSKAALPFIIAEICALMILTYVPDLVLFVPHMLGYI
jgi:tripartite ATP-independent transporter DctM subunit